MVTSGELRNFVYLQFLDLLTTLVFLVNGVEEGNPVIKLLIRTSGSPLVGLLAVKIAALGFGCLCSKLARNALLSRANVFFGVLVAWNLMALLISSAAR